LQTRTESTLLPPLSFFGWFAELAAALFLYSSSSQGCKNGWLCRGQPAGKAHSHSCNNGWPFFFSRFALPFASLGPVAGATLHAGIFGHFKASLGVSMSFLRSRSRANRGDSQKQGKGSEGQVPCTASAHERESVCVGNGQICRPAKGAAHRKRIIGLMEGEGKSGNGVSQYCQVGPGGEIVRAHCVERGPEGEVE
jgi:hypothetical protein